MVGGGEDIKWQDMLIKAPFSYSSLHQRTIIEPNLSMD